MTTKVAMMMSSHTRLGYGATLAMSVALLVGLGSVYQTAAPAMAAAALVAVLVVAPLAARAGFRFGARRGVEAAIEMMGTTSRQDDYVPNSSGSTPAASGEPSADR